MKKVLTLFVITAFLVQLTLPVFANTKTYSDEYLNVTRKTRHLHSRLSKDYTGYEYTFLSKNKNNIKIKEISFKDNVSGQTAYTEVKRTGVRAAGETIAWGAGLAFPTCTLSLIGAIIACPFVIAGSLAGNVGANMEGKRYDKTLKEETTATGEEGTVVKAIAAHHITPVMTLLYINPKTNGVEKLICE